MRTERVEDASVKVRNRVAVAILSVAILLAQQCAGCGAAPLGSVGGEGEGGGDSAPALVELTGYSGNGSVSLTIYGVPVAVSLVADDKCQSVTVRVQGITAVNRRDCSPPQPPIVLPTDHIPNPDLEGEDETP